MNDEERMCVNGKIAARSEGTEVFSAGGLTLTLGEAAGLSGRCRVGEERVGG